MQKGETVSQFLAEVGRLSEQRDFKATLDDMQRDRIVCGFGNAICASVQRRLLHGRIRVTFKKAFKLVGRIGGEKFHRHSVHSYHGCQHGRHRRYMQGPPVHVTAVAVSTMEGDVN